MTAVITCRSCGNRINGLPVRALDRPEVIARDGFAYHQICAPRDEAEAERNRQLADLKARSPMRSTAAQADAGHLPLFIAGNEPTLL